MHEMSHVGIKVEPRSRLTELNTSYLASNFIYVIKIYVLVHSCVNYATVESNPQIIIQLKKFSKVLQPGLLF